MIIKGWMCTVLIVLLLMLVPLCAGAAKIKAISAGTDSMVLMDDGTVYEWGNNASHSTPEKIQGLINITAISTHNCNHMALKDDGTVLVWVWLDSQTSQPNLVQVPISNVKAISVPTMLKDDGTVWEIVPPLNNPYLAVDVYNASATVSVRQVSGLDNVKYIGRNVALKDNGSVWMWGGATSPTRIDISNVKEVESSNMPFMASNTATILALKNDGTVWAWGSNGEGLFGNGTTSYKVNETTFKITDETTLAPVQAKGISDATSISIEDSNAMALKNDGSVWVWGGGGYNALGVYAAGDFLIPQKLGSLDNIVAISMGRGHGMALKSDGTLWAWGANFQGQLGDGTVTPPLEHNGGKDKPVKVLIDTSGLSSVYASPTITITAASFGNGSVCPVSFVSPSTYLSSAIPASGDSSSMILVLIALVIVSGMAIYFKVKWRL